MPGRHGHRSLRPWMNSPSPQTTLLHRHVLTPTNWCAARTTSNHVLLHKLRSNDSIFSLQLATNCVLCIEAAQQPAHRCSTVAVSAPCTAERAMSCQQASRDETLSRRHLRPHKVFELTISSRSLPADEQVRRLATLNSLPAGLKGLPWRPRQHCDSRSDPPSQTVQCV